MLWMLFSMGRRNVTGLARMIFWRPKWHSVSTALKATATLYPTYTPLHSLTPCIPSASTSVFYTDNAHGHTLGDHCCPVLRPEKGPKSWTYLGGHLSLAMCLKVSLFTIIAQPPVIADHLTAISEELHHQFHFAISTAWKPLARRGIIPCPRGAIVQREGAYTSPCPTKWINVARVP
jgi:hypothetical protein